MNPTQHTISTTQKRNRTISVCGSTFTGKDPRKGWRIPLNEIKYNEQRDEETGYGYFGARYMDHELMTMWLSVDPMADKYPSISPYAYCAWNPVRLVDPDGREFSEQMEKHSKKLEKFCESKINQLKANGELSENQQNTLTELQNALTEIQSMRDDKTTYYDFQSGSFGENNRKSIGDTHYKGRRDSSQEGKSQHWMMVSINTDRNTFTKEGNLNMKGLLVFAHELKHCYQFYNKELLYVQSDDGYKAYNTQALEEAAFKRGSALGSGDRYNPENYPNLSTGTIDQFINANPGCTLIKHI